MVEHTVALRFRHLETGLRVRFEPELCVVEPHASQSSNLMDASFDGGNLDAPCVSTLLTPRNNAVPNQSTGIP